MGWPLPCRSGWRRRLADITIVTTALLAAAFASAAPVVSSGSSLGQTQKLGPSTIHGAWSLSCPPKPDAVCSLNQVVARDPKGSQVVLGVAVVPVKVQGHAPRLRFEFRMSPKAVQPAGIGMKVGDGPEYRLAIAHCDHQVCTAGGWLDADLRKALESSPAAQVAFLMPPRQQVLVPLALGGIGEGLRALEARAR